MPADCDPSAFFNTLGVLLESQQCQVNILVGDFTVDFDRCGALANSSVDFHMRALAVQLTALMKVMMGLHVHGLTILLYSQFYSSLVTNVYTISLGCNLSDHYPLYILNLFTD